MKDPTFTEYFFAFVEAWMLLIIGTVLYGLVWGVVTFAFLWGVDPSYIRPVRPWLGIALGGLVSSGLVLLAIRKWRKK